MVRKGHKNIPACCDEEGDLAQAYQYQENFVHYLKEIQQECPDIISENVNVGEDYGIIRLFRRVVEVRTLNTRAPEKVFITIN